MSKLSDKLELSLRSRFEVSPGKFIVIRRPLPGDIRTMARSGKTDHILDVICEFCVSWEGFCDIDFFPGGDDTQTPFDKELFVLWIFDHEEHWLPLAKAIDALTVEHEQRVADAKKK